MPGCMSSIAVAIETVNHVDVVMKISNFDHTYRLLKSKSKLAQVITSLRAKTMLNRRL